MTVRLREWRRRGGYSVRELATRAGVGFATVHRIETGRMNPTVEMLEKLAKALGVHIRDFFGPKRTAKRRTKR